MVRVAHGGAAIEVEVWELPAREFGSFVAGIPAPLGIGTVELADGTRCKALFARPTRRSRRMTSAIWVVGGLICAAWVDGALTMASLQNLVGDECLKGINIRFKSLVGWRQHF